MACIPEGHGRLRGRGRFFNLDASVFVTTRVTELRDHCILDFPEGPPPPAARRRRRRRLLHPFTGDVVNLPPLTTLVPQLDRPQVNGDKNILPCIRRVSAHHTCLASQQRSRFPLDFDPSFRSQMAIRRRPRSPAPDFRILPCDHGTKRRRAAVADAASSPWASMHTDLVALIAERVLAGHLLDYVRFRAACRHWRHCTVDPRGRGVSDPRFHPRRWMMLPEGHGLHPGHGRLRGRARFFNLDTGVFVAARVPELRDHCILDSPDGLLLLQRDADAAVRLLHPFTGDVVDLPPLTTLVPQLDRPQVNGDKNILPCIRRVSAAVSVAPATGTVVVLLALELLHRFAHASTADKSWTLTGWSAGLHGTTLSFHGSLFMVQCAGNEALSILRLDPPPVNEEDDGSSSPPLSPPQTVARLPGEIFQAKLVECESEILVVGSTGSSRDHLVVMRLADLLPGRRPAVPLTSIGDHCLFLGTRSLAVSSKGLPSVAGNAIIFCDYMHGSRLQQYNLGVVDGDDSLSPACDAGMIWSPPPSPHSMVHHLVTCCHRNFWNKGLIYWSMADTRWRTKSKWRSGA
ncbi:hypothetical protein ACP70R_014402 [Stipagrostis hirtigluma subsp. patula]